MLPLLLGCATGSGNPPDTRPLPVPDAKALPVMEAAPAPAPPCGRLVPQLWPSTASSDPVEVVVDTLGPVALPASFTASAAAEAGGTGSIQGSLPGTELCLVAGLDNVLGVRTPMLAAPKAP